MRSFCSCSWSRIALACFACGLFEKSKSVVSEPLRRVPDAPNPKTRMTAQMATVRPGCRLLARASVSGFSFTGSPLTWNDFFPCFQAHLDVRCTLTVYEGYVYGVSLSSRTSVNVSRTGHRRTNHHDYHERTRASDPRAHHRRRPSRDGHRRARGRLDAPDRS